MFFDQLSLVASHVQAITPHIAPESNDNPTAVVDAPDTIEDPPDLVDTPDYESDNADLPISHDNTDPKIRRIIATAQIPVVRQLIDPDIGPDGDPFPLAANASDEPRKISLKEIQNGPDREKW
jgi:hypothetical protein